MRRNCAPDSSDRILRERGALLPLTASAAPNFQQSGGVPWPSERLLALFHHRLVGIVITSPEKRWQEVNDTWCEMVGYSRDELATMDWATLTHPEDLPADVAQFSGWWRVKSTITVSRNVSSEKTAQFWKPRFR